MKIALFFLAFALSGCWGRMEEVAIDPDLPPHAQEAAVLALEEMFEAIPEARVHVYVGKSRGMGAVVLATKRNRNPCKDSMADTHLTWLEGPEIRLCMRNMKKTSETRLKTVVLHELGHAIRADDVHFEEKGHLMSEVTPFEVTGPSDEDLAFIRGKLDEN